MHVHFFKYRDLAIISISTFNLEIENKVLTNLIKKIHMEHKGRYGARRIQLHLQQDYQQYVLVEGGLDVSFINAGYFREEQEENIGNNQAIISIQIL